MTTRRELITEKYETLQRDMKQWTDEPILPSLSDIDVADLMYFITMTFLGATDDKTIRERLNDIVKLHGIQVSDQQFDALFPLVKAFLDWLKTI